MERPVEISQTWRSKGWNPETKKPEFVPIVRARETHYERMKPIKREIWLEYIRRGFLDVSSDLEKWLKENGLLDVIPNSKRI